MIVTLSRKSALFLAAGLLLALLIFALFHVDATPAEVFKIVQETSFQRRPEIPNLVHYIWAMKDDSHEIKFDFEKWLSVYSSSLFLEPDKIYIHTNAREEDIELAREAGNEWTRLILQMPNVVTNQVVIPNVTTTGKGIGMMEHKSDFARMNALIEFGGIYMDFDVTPIRSMTSIRRSGYKNVVGQERNDGINNGFMMAVKNSMFMNIFREQANEVFDGLWATHSTELLRDLSFRLMPIEGEVLILPQAAFAPGSWTPDDTRDLLSPRNDTPPATELLPNGGPRYVEATKEDALRYWEERKDTDGKEEWEKDYSRSYAIHAFDNIGEANSWGGITAKYCLERRSNFARAVYPAVWHAVVNNVITVEGFEPPDVLS